MGRWSRYRDRQGKYKVKVHYMKHGTARITLPSPLVKLFNNPESLVYEISEEDQRVIIYPVRVSEDDKVQSSSSSV